MGKILELINENSILYAVITTEDGSTWQEYGDKASVAHQGIITQYIPGPEAIPMLFDMLHKQVIPQTTRQGIVTCLITKPNEATIAVILIHDDSDVISRRRRASKIDKELQSLFQ